MHPNLVHRCYLSCSTVAASCEDRAYFALELEGSKPPNRAKPITKTSGESELTQGHQNQLNKLVQIEAGLKFRKS